MRTRLKAAIHTQEDVLSLFNNRGSITKANAASSMITATKAENVSITMGFKNINCIYIEICFFHKELMQKEVYAHLEIANSNYNKLENGHRDLSVDELLKLSKLFNLTTDPF
jgi:hypothetical protein